MEIKINEQDLHAFPFSDRLKSEIVKNCGVIQQLKGEIALAQGDPVHRIPLYLSGESILTRYSLEKDKNYIICRVKAGGTCPTSLSSVLSNQPSPITGVAVQDAIKVIVPSRFVFSWQSEFPSWSEFLLKTLASGYTSVLGNFHQAMTQTVEERITEFLSSGDYTHSNLIHMTHEELAHQIGTSRVVVSRVLKNLENTGIVSLSRGKITLHSAV